MKEEFLVRGGPRVFYSSGGRPPQAKPWVCQGQPISHLLLHFASGCSKHRWVGGWQLGKHSCLDY